ncbi:hypothetical protein UFOVP1299_37 [uncultured Caudovirales phage]|uniref:Uncharacterized protein n=1 Tax=uncultured Caudovirales phage TaxID=2100421 RepID=A0A6J5RQB6_9CAUD|nr:hypothetical protein UFOVP1299_37 [uncultured Caudovirales phage]
MPTLFNRADAAAGIGATAQYSWVAPAMHELAVMPVAPLLLIITVVWLIQRAWIAKATRKSTEDAIVIASGAQAAAMLKLLSDAMEDSSRASDALIATLDHLTKEFRETTTAITELGARLSRNEGRCSACPKQTKE